MIFNIPRNEIVEIVKSAAEEAELTAAETATLVLTAEQEPVLAFGQYAIPERDGEPRCECPLVASGLIVNAPQFMTPLDEFTKAYDRAVRSRVRVPGVGTSGRLVIA